MRIMRIVKQKMRIMRIKIHPVSKVYFPLNQYSQGDLEMWCMHLLL